MAATEVELDAAKGLAEQRLLDLNSVVLDGKKPPPGPYAFFHHNSHAIERLRDVHRSVRRLLVNRQQLRVLAEQEEKMRATYEDHDSDAFVADITPIWNSSHEATEHMKQDFESVYLFGGILLDQWSHLAILIGGEGIGRQHPFRKLVRALETGSAPLLRTLWVSTRVDMLWAFHHIRFYRNHFIVHADRPWQRGSTHGLHTDDFRLFTPSPPGWLKQGDLSVTVDDLLSPAPPDLQARLSSLRTNPRTCLEAMFDTIGEFPSPEARREIEKVYGKVGGQTPTFQVVAGRIYRFIQEGTEILVEIAQTNMSAVRI